MRTSTAVTTPVSRRRRLVLVAMFIDSLGGGLFNPFELLYGIKVAGLSLATTGVLATIAAGAAVAVGPLAGAASDRFGPSRVVTVANAVGAAGCVALLAWPNAGGYLAGGFLLAAAQRAFYGAFTPFIASLTEMGHLERWFGHVRASRHVGLTLGQAVSGAALLAGQATGLRMIVALDGVSYLAALGCLVLASRGVDRTAPPAPEESAGGYRAVLADRPNLALAGVNVAATLLIVVPMLATPVFVVEHLELPVWLPGILAAVMTGVLVVGSVVSPRLLSGRRRLRNLQRAAAIWVGAFACLLLSASEALPTIAVLVAAMALIGFGEALYAPTADALPAALAPPHLQGRYAAVHQSAWGVSDTLSPAMSGFLLSVNDWLLWLVLALVASASVGAYRALERPVGRRDGVAGVAGTDAA